MAAALVIAEPESAARGFLERHLADDGFDVVSGTDLRGLVAQGRPDLVLLGDATALERWDPGVPVIVLGAATDDAYDRVRAFRRGCDDYVDRPFHYDELLSRVSTSRGDAVSTWTAWLSGREGALARLLVTRCK